MTGRRFSNYPVIVVTDNMINILLVVFAYLMGSIPVGVILSKLKGVDPRKTGSGNIGATNVMRAAGKKLGIITLICDAAKGFIPVILAICLDTPSYVIALAGFMVFLGHLFPVFLRFRGGKGVATALGVYLAVSPAIVIGAFIVFAIVFAIWRYVSLASLTGAIVIPVALYIVRAPCEFVAMSAVIAVLVVVRHRDNISRLISGTESKTSFSGGSGKN